MEVLLVILGALVLANSLFNILGRVAPHSLVFVASLLQVVAALLLTVAERGNREGTQSLLSKIDVRTGTQLIEREKKVSESPTAVLVDQQDRTKSEV
jgi:hypothetical protein